MKAQSWPFVLLLFAAANAHGQANALPQTRHILVYGEAKARAIPDRFRIEMTFDVIDPRADAARRKVEEYLAEAIRELRLAGVSAGEITATSLEIEPQNEYDQDARKQVFKGTRVSRKLSARFRDQARLKDFLASLETSKEVQVSGVETELSSETELRRQLRQKAIASTRAKGRVIAEAYGVGLAGLYSVSDTAPQFEYGIREGDWPEMYEWTQSEGATSLDRIEVTGSRIKRSEVESFETGYVSFEDRIYAVFLISE